MPRKRTRGRTKSNGEGSIYWSDHYRRYVGQVTIAREGEKLLRKKFFGPRGDRSRIARLGIEERVRPYVSRRARGSTETLAVFTKRWIETAPIRAKTRDQYEWVANKYLGSLGARRLIEIEPSQIRQHLSTLDVGPRSRRALYTVLHRVLREAVDLELIIRNPAANVTPPKVPKPEMRALRPEQVPFLLEAVAGDRLEAFVVLALTSTMGPGEMLALRWRDVHLEEGYLLVQADLVESKFYGYRPTLEPTKTQRRRRRIDLPSIALAALRRRRDLTRSEANSDFVFATLDGQPIRLSGLRKRWWKQVLERAADLAAKKKQSFPVDLRIYELRHTANALMGLAGVPLEVARDRMGHSSIKTTADVYGHLYAARKSEAVTLLDTLFARLHHSLPHGRSTGNVRKAKKRR
jgi:integrase